MKTSELIGPALDWAVAKCEGIVGEDGQPKIFRWTGSRRASIRYQPIADTGYYHPHNDWAQGGPIIEREKISFAFNASLLYETDSRWKAMGAMYDAEHFYGPTPLIASMRCYVASKLGDEIEIPEELQ